VVAAKKAVIAPKIVTTNRAFSAYSKIGEQRPKRKTPAGTPGKVKKGEKKLVMTGYRGW
jgi:hypothetical protein